MIYAPRIGHAAAPSVSCSSSADFTVDISPDTSLTMLPSSTTPLTVTVTPLNGFTGTVTLAIAQVSVNITATFSTPTSLDLSSGPKTAGISVSTSNTVIAGDFYNFDVNATTTSTLFHDNTVTVYVPTPDLDISTTQNFIGISMSSPGTNTVNLQAVYGLTDPSVSLSAQITLLGTPTTVLIASFNPTTVSLSPSTGVGSSTVTVTATSSATPGIYSVYIVATTIPSGVTNSTLFLVQLEASGFGIDASPTFLDISPGSSSTSTINVTSILSFSGSVGLSATPTVPGLTVGFNPPSITISSGTRATSTMSVAVASSVPPNFYTLKVIGTSGTTTNSTSVTVDVLGPSFSIDASPSPLTVSNSGSSVPSTVTLKSLSGFAGNVNLSMDCSPDGLQALLTPSVVMLSTGGTSSATLTVNAYSWTPPGSYHISIFGSNTTSLASNLTEIQVHVTGPTFSLSTNPSATFEAGVPTSATIDIASLRGFSGTVQLTTEVLASNFVISTALTATVNPPSVSLTSGTTAHPTLILTSSTPGTYYVFITGDSWPGPIENYTLVSVTVTSPGAPDFAVEATQPSSAPADGTSTAVSTISISPVNSFTGTVSLGYTPLMPGLNCGGGISPNSISGSQTATLTCTSTAANSYPVTITGTSSGTSGSLVRMTTTTFTFTSVSAPDFTISATPATAVADGSTAAISTVTINPLNYFTGSVTLSATAPNQLNCQPLTHVTITPSGQSSLSCTSTTPGYYSVQITGTSSGIPSRSYTAAFTFTPTQPPPTPDVALSISTTSLNFNSGSSGTATITVSPLNGFSGNVQYSASAPSGLSCNFNPTSTPASGTTTLTCNGSAAGDYTVTLTATPSGEAAKSRTITVHVAAVSPVSPAPKSTIFGLDPTVFYTILGVVAVGVIAGLLLVVRSRSKGPKPAN